MKILHYAVVLGLICIAAAFGVAGTFSITRDRIIEKDRQEKTAAVSKVVGGGADSALKLESLNPEAEESERVTVARTADGAIAGYAAMGEAQGYGGSVRVIVGMDAAAEKLVGLTVLPNRETPGLGSRVAEVESKNTWWSVLTRSRPAEETAGEDVPAYLKQFGGLTLDQMHLKSSGGSIQAITGATISSNAVVEAARNAVTKIRTIVAGAPADRTSSTE